MRRLLPLAVLVVAFVAAAGGPAPRASAADCVPLRVVFYAANDWVRLGQRLAAISSPCVQYYISVPPLADKITPRPDQARRFRAHGPNFHGLAEINVEGWTGWVSSTGSSWYAAGVEARKRMDANGYEVASGDSWALNELSSTVRVGSGAMRANMLEFARGLYEGDASPVRGVVFTTGLSSATNELSLYQTRLQEWYEDAAFWTAMQTYVSDWAQEEYGDIRNYAVAGADQATRRASLNDYLLHPLALARAAPETAATARGVMESSFTPVANAAWEYDQSFGYTSVAYELMADYVSAQVDALRSSGWPRFGFAWAPRNSTGMAPADFTAQTNAIIDRLAASIADASQACVSPWCTGVLDGSWLHTGWRTFAQWKPAQLVFTSAQQTVVPGAVSQPLAVELRTNTGLAYTAGQPVAVTFSSSSPAGAFSASPGGPWTPTLTIAVPSGAGAAGAYYRDTQTGTATVTASAPGKVAAAQAATVQPTDAVPPETTLASAPAKVVRSTAVSLSFASEAGARFECSLDGAPFTPCSVSVAYVKLKQGRHTFAVRAVDAAGNADPTPARASWITDSLAPDTRIRGRALKGRTLARFWFSAGEQRVRFECSLDGSRFVACKSPFGYFPLSRGRHTFRVRGIDAAGNVESSPASLSWRVR